MLCCPIGRQIGLHYTDFFAASRNARKRPEIRRPDVEFKPIQPRTQTDREDAGQLHETAGGQGSTSPRRRMPETPPRPPARSGLTGPLRCKTGSAGGLARPTVEPEAGKLTLVRTPVAEMRQDVREFIRRLEAVGLTVEFDTPFLALCG